MIGLTALYCIVISKTNMPSLTGQCEPTPKSYSRLEELKERNANLYIFVSPSSEQLCGILVGAASSWTHFRQFALLSLLAERNVTFPTVVNLSAAVAAVLVLASVIGSVSAATENRLVVKFQINLARVSLRCFVTMMDLSAVT